MGGALHRMRNKTCTIARALNSHLPHALSLHNTQIGLGSTKSSEAYIVPRFIGGDPMFLALGFLLSVSEVVSCE